MKTYFYTAVLVITFLLPLSTHANTFCVSDATGLQTALTTASGNGEDDTVQIEQGTYVGSFIYASTEAFSLTVEGGYISGCGSRGLDPTNTVLDANNSGPVLVLSGSGVVADFLVDGVTIQNGMVSGNGGGVYVNTLGEVIISNNIIMGNTADDYGGGIYAYHLASVTLINNTIAGNSSNWHAGGVYVYLTDLVNFTNNFITGNTSASRGGGIYTYYAISATLTNNTISGNTAYWGGGVIVFESDYITLSNNTITENTSNGSNGGGGGFYILVEYNSAEASVTNNIIWNNTATGLGNDLYINNDGNGDYIPSTVNLFNNNFDQSGDGTYIQIPFTIDPSNLDNEDPLFVDAPNDDYHLTDLSPCIDTGRLEGAPEDDMDGHPRPQGDGVDIGADEYIPPDADEDGVPNDEDNCPNDANPDQTDTDHDCIGDVCDDFPNDYDPTVPDSDGDGVGNACDVCPYDFDDDIDADGLCGNEDNCTVIPNGPQLGTCVNTATNAVGTTCMNDGECDTGETCSNNQEDTDNDGSGDACDSGTFCRGLADYDQDVDALDLTMFLSHFGRGHYVNPCPPNGPTPVPKTGQTTSYATGDDGDLQRGVALVTPRFTDNDDGTVTDNQTGLIWLKNANCFGMRTWEQSLLDCNGLASGSCGLTDGSNVGSWRLPNSDELASLVHEGYYDLALPNAAGTGQWSEGDPFNNVQSSSYWSSTTNALNSMYGWNVSMYTGGVGNVTDKGESWYVWPVRGGH